IAAQTGLSELEINNMHRFTLGHKRVVNMTKGGRAAQHFVMCIVGSPEKGLLGIGQGKNPQMGKASDQAFSNALKNIDTVRRFQNRTVWGGGDNMRIKYGAVVCQMRARPPGFGLMCSPTLHHIFTACGIKDVSAKMYGSMNVMQALKALGHILHGGSKSPGLGNGVGGPSLTTDKGRGMRGVEEIELERGRYGVEVGSKITRI
ncbi:hypothetical protein BDY24DRAFT_337232, partial [Mrakia frigida]|uniref:mitochondrial 37S ribosomal protein uS5m MRPS5 n=1 Tax=Mrakia frigida TaxID=29902 RepID=UPI003FCBF8F0